MIIGVMLEVERIIQKVKIWLVERQNSFDFSLKHQLFITFVGLDMISTPFIFLVLTTYWSSFFCPKIQNNTINDYN